MVFNLRFEKKIIFFFDIVADLLECSIRTSFAQKVEKNAAVMKTADERNANNEKRIEKSSKFSKYCNFAFLR